MPPSADDDDLIQRVGGGDEDALAALFGRWQPLLRRFALRMSGSPEMADDVVQEVFVALIDNARRFDPSRGGASGWLYGIARKQVLRRLERERPHASLEDAEIPVVAPELLEGVARERDAQRLHAALAALPEHYREVVVLCDLQGLAYDSAAEALGCPVGTVRSRLHRARALLAERLRGAPAPAVRLLPSGARS